MKKGFIKIFATLLLAAGGGYIVNNYTDNDIILENGDIIENKELKHHLTNKYRDRDIDTVTLYLHHTVTRKDATIEQINKIHLNNGWEKVSYHVAVRDNGEINILNNLILSAKLNKIN